MQYCKREQSWHINPVDYRRDKYVSHSTPQTSRKTE